MPGSQEMTAGGYIDVFLKPGEEKVGYFVAGQKFHLTEEEIEEITRRYLKRIQQNLAREGKSFHYTGAAVEALAEIGFSLKYGARFLKRRIDEQVKIPITLHWKEGEEFSADAQGGRLTLTWKP